MPEANETPSNDQVEFLRRLKNKEESASKSFAKGFSICRICNRANGSAEYDLGKWTWPEGYRHYVESHNVRPSPKFKAFILGY